MAFKMKGFKAHNMYKTERAKTPGQHKYWEEKGYDHSPYNQYDPVKKPVGPYSPQSMADYMNRQVHNLDARYPMKRPPRDLDNQRRPKKNKKSAFPKKSCTCWKKKGYVRDYSKAPCSEGSCKKD